MKKKKHKRQQSKRKRLVYPIKRLRALHKWITREDSPKWHKDQKHISEKLRNFIIKWERIEELKTILTRSLGRKEKQRK